MKSARAVKMFTHKKNKINKINKQEQGYEVGQSRKHLRKDGKISKQEQSHEVGHGGKLHFVQSIFVSFVQNISGGFCLLKTKTKLRFCSAVPSCFFCRNHMNISRLFKITSEFVYWS